MKTIMVLLLILLATNVAAITVDGVPGIEIYKTCGPNCLQLQTGGDVCIRIYSDGRLEMQDWSVLLIGEEPVVTEPTNDY